jgi:hypothetical protein
MATPAQIAANTANARLSTGPRTVEGKANSSRNARTHGLTSKDVVVFDEDLDEFFDLRDSLRADLQPSGAAEEVVFDQVVHAAWDMRRVRRVEVESIECGADPLKLSHLGETTDRLQRYLARSERAFYRGLKELRALQTNRAIHAACVDADAIPPLASVESLAKLETAKRTQSVRAADEDFEREMAELDAQTHFLIQEVHRRECAAAAAEPKS